MLYPKVYHMLILTVARSTFIIVTVNNTITVLLCTSGVLHCYGRCYTWNLVHEHIDIQ